MNATQVKIMKSVFLATGKPANAFGTGMVRSVPVMVVGFFLMLSYFAPPVASAQEMSELESVGVDHTVLPLIGYRSDDGLIAGGFYQRIDYGEGVRPFASQSSVQLTASTRANLAGKFEHETTTTFGRAIRSRYYLEILRYPRQTFFGVGNRTGFDRELFDNEYYYYYYLDRSIRFDYSARRTFLSDRGEGVDGQFRIRSSYHSPVELNDETLFAEQAVPGSEGGLATQIGAGFILDRRNNEFNPTSGYRLESHWSAAHRLTASQYDFSLWMAEARYYISPFRDVVIAQKLQWQQAFGEPPFWEMPSVGNELGLRGYALERFRGERSILHIMEIRTWLFSVLDDHIRFGGQLFMDTGRVFTGNESWTDLPDGLRQTFGIGGAISLLNPDFVFRGELGFSDELYRIYIGIGYLF